MAKTIETMENFAKLIHDILISDRDVNIGVSGFTGEGKSTFLTKLLKEYGKISERPWNFKYMTWSRKELMEWIDGKKGSKPDDETGLKKNQLPLYSAMLVDELFHMFYSRNWFREDQIDSIATLNMCRDRRLLIAGNVPNFWELDKSFTSRIRFYGFIPKRGVAWIFQQENNPFCSDNWNVQENKKIFRQGKTPYKISNFVCEIHFDDWDPKEKEQYYKIRNTKRVIALQEKPKDEIERYRKIKKQRDDLIRWILLKYPDIKQVQIAKICNLYKGQISKINDGYG